MACSIVEMRRANGDRSSILLLPILGERQRLAVLRQTVNLFPSGKHWRFNSSLPRCKVAPCYVSVADSSQKMKTVAENGMKIPTI